MYEKVLRSFVKEINKIIDFKQEKNQDFETLLKKDKMDILNQLISNSEIKKGLDSLVSDRKTAHDRKPTLSDIRKRATIEKQKRYSKGFSISQSSKNPSG